jgi:chromosome segregation protein
MLAWLLRGVVLVESLDGADATRADLCFVTPSGQLLCGPRVEGGHFAEGHAGLVVRRSQIQDLAVAAEAVDGKLKALADGKERATSRVERLKAESRAVGAALSEARRHVQAAEGQLSRIQARSTDVTNECIALEREAEELAFTMARARAILGKALFNQRLLTVREERRAVVESALTVRIGDAETAANAASNAEQETRLRQAKVGEGRSGIVRAIQMHEESLREIDAGLEELADVVQKNEDAAAKAEAEAMRFEEAAAAFDDELVEVEARRAEADARHEDARQQRKQAQQDLTQCDQSVRDAGEAMNAKKLEVVDLEHRFSRLEDRLREEAGVELLRCLGDVHGLGIEFVDDAVGPPAPMGLVECLQGPPLPPSVIEHWYGMSRLWEREGFDVQETRREVQVLQSQKDRLGAVNLDAVAELEAEEGQVGTLEQEVTDLKEARRALMETLRKLEAESKTLFEQTFAEARKNFQDIFRKLFQGGKADMFLHETEDLLEAGIEIVAQPPGKQLQSINLLSGGERSMTAVAILFALFKVRPSPFCILDEVDAALDETNVERFLRVLRDFTEGTQFCIVTHHKRTMAECQALYGITMQRRGVSSRIAVALAEVDSFQGGGPDKGKPDPAKKQRIAGEEAVGFG